MPEVLNAIAVIFQPMNLLLITCGMALGIVFGAVPGLTATLAIALLVPFTFNMDPVPALVLLISIFNGGMYGSSITAITIRTPGAPASAVTVLDGYELAKQGKAGLAIGISCIAGTIGGLMSAAIMIFLSPPLARAALAFSAPEYFAVGVFGLTAVLAVSGQNLVKGILAALFGLLISTIGLDPVFPFPRFTMGVDGLTAGIRFLPAVIGVFAVAEAFRLIEQKEVAKKTDLNIGRVLPTWTELRCTLKETFRGGIIGTLIGILPGAGGTIAAYVSYAESKRASKNPEKYGTGCLEGVASPESANNALTGGAMIPMLTLGIPGDSVTAVLLAALMVQGLQPGPLLFRDHRDVIYPIFAALILSNLVMLVMGLLVIKPVSLIANVPPKVLVPVIAVFGLVGGFAESGDVNDIYLAVVFGIIGYLMEKYGFPVAPLVLALILGPMIEYSFRQSLILSAGDWTTFFTRPISLGLLLAGVGIAAALVYRQRKKPLEC